MTDFQTSAPLFITIIAIYLVAILFVFGGRKAFFEPWKEPPGEKGEE